MYVFIVVQIKLVVVVVVVVVDHHATPLPLLDALVLHLVGSSIPN